MRCEVKLNMILWEVGLASLISGELRMKRHEERRANGNYDYQKASSGFGHHALFFNKTQSQFFAILKL